MRKRITQMQDEVNEFMTYVKKELARGLDDWEQRLSTALVKSAPADLVRATPAAGEPSPVKEPPPSATGESPAASARRRS
jgi:hypothetical protein